MSTRGQARCGDGPPVALLNRGEEGPVFAMTRTAQGATLVRPVPAHNDTGPSQFFDKVLRSCHDEERFTGEAL